MTLGEKQELFAELEAKWVTWVLSHPGWHLRHGEGRISPLGADGKGRKVKKLGVPMRVQDAEHMEGGTHYLGVGADWNLFVNGEWITAGDHPAWVACSEYWLSLHGLARSGRSWGDTNHISLEHDGKK